MYDYFAGFMLIGTKTLYQYELFQEIRRVLCVFVREIARELSAVWSTATAMAGSWIDGAATCALPVTVAVTTSRRPHIWQV